MVNLFDNLNLSNSNYSAPLGEGAAVNVQISDNNQVLSTLKALMPGQTLEGQLVSQDGKALQLLIGNNTLLNTTLDAQANLSLGQNISFEVKSNNGGQLVLRPLHTNLGNEATAVKALESASVKVSEETIRMVDGLMKEGMPINRETLQSMNRDMNLYPDADINDLIMLHKMDMPVNENNISQMHLYNNNNQWMMENVDNMSQDIMELLASSDEETYMTLVDKLENVFSDKNATDVVLNANEQGKVIIAEEQIVTGDNENASLAKLNDSKNVFDLLKSLSPDKISDKDTAAVIKKHIGEVISDKFLMEPEKVADKEYVKNYYEKILDNIKDIEQFLGQSGKSDTSLAKSMSGMKNNINFMNQMNELYNYVQLPLKMAGGQAQGDLYVYAKKHGQNQKSESEPLTALLHLSMEYLGNMDIFLKLSEGKLNTDFSLEKEEMIDFIEAHIDELNRRLIDKGYNVSTKVGKLDDNTKNVIDEIRSESPSVSILSNQSFDARA